MNNTKLKLGILLDSYEIPAWAYFAIDRILKSEDAEFSFIVLNEGGVQKKPPLYLLKKLWNKRSQILCHLYNRVDEDRFGKYTDAFKAKNIRDLIPDIPVINVVPVQKQYSDYFAAADIARIREYQPDILIRMGFGILRGDVLTAARYGIWSYHHGDNRINRGGPPGFWEVVESHPATGAVLQILNDTLDGGRVIDRTYARTNFLSPVLNRNTYYWTAAVLLPRQIARLVKLGEEKFFALADRGRTAFDFYDRRLYRIPGALETLKIAIRQFARIAYDSFIRRFYYHQWCILYDLGDDILSTLYRYKTIVPPSDRFWADPFVVHENNTYYIFMEELPYQDKKGYLSVIEMDQSGVWKPPVKILEQDYHLSYPFVFQWQGRYYLIPESKDNNTIDLYESVSFPYQWQFKKNLIDNIRAVDATLHYTEGKWWLFAAVTEVHNVICEEELWIFYADDLFADRWTPHPLNPVVADVRSARPAGRIFNRDGKWYRPSQDCSTRYGYGFNINEIVCLNEHEYEEKTIAAVKPNWDKDILGTHTFNREGRLTVSDAYRRRLKYFNG